MPSKSVIAVVIVLSVSSVAQAGSEDDAKTVFQQMAVAAKKLNYEGRFVYNRNGRMDTMHILHTFDGSEEFEQLTSLNGMSWKVIRKGNQVFCPFPGESGQGLRHNKLRNLTGLHPKNTLKALNEYYHFKLLRKERVAGRVCHVVAILPKDVFRYGYQLWIDVETGQLMRNDIISTDGKTIEQMMFTSIKFFQVAPKINQQFEKNPYFAKPQKGALSNIETAKQVNWKAGPRQVRWQMDLPPGFFLAEHDEGQDTKDLYEHMVFTDGIASISVFIERQTSKKPKLKQAVTQGAINAMAWNKEKYGHVTVVGEVPQATVSKIANSLHHTGP